MSEPEAPDRDELLRLREENLRLREERIKASERVTETIPPVINVNQKNESCLSGCAGIIAISIAAAWFLTKCSG